MRTIDRGHGVREGIFDDDPSAAVETLAHPPLARPEQTAIAALTERLAAVEADRAELVKVVAALYRAVEASRAEVREMRDAGGVEGLGGLPARMRTLIDHLGEGERRDDLAMLVGDQLDRFKAEVRPELRALKAMVGELAKRIDDALYQAELSKSRIGTAEARINILSAPVPSAGPFKLATEPKVEPFY